MWKTVFSHKDIIKLSYDFVAVVGHGNTAHKEGDYVVNGKKEHLCEVYNLPNCKSHEDMRNEMNRRNLLPGVRGTPTHIVYNPHDLKEISREHGQSVSAIEKQIAAAQKTLGKPITWKDYSKTRKPLDEARELLSGDKPDYRKALRALKGFDAKGMKALELEVEQIKNEILAAGEKGLADARELIEAGDKGKATKLLRTLARDFAGTDIESEAKKLLAEAKAE